MASKDNFKSLKMERREFHDKVINFYNTEENTPYNYRQVADKVGATTAKQRALIVEILEQLTVDGFLCETDPGRFKAAQRTAVAEGVFIRRSNGKNSVDISTGPDDDQKPIFVAERNSLHALNGDRVLVHISAARPGLEPEAEVLKIIEAKDQVFIGTLQVKKYFAHLRQFAYRQQIPCHRHLYPAQQTQRRQDGRQGSGPHSGVAAGCQQPRGRDYRRAGCGW